MTVLTLMGPIGNKDVVTRSASSRPLRHRAIAETSYQQKASQDRCSGGTGALFHFDL
jgi:hypothetical protein